MVGAAKPPAACEGMHGILAACEGKHCILAACEGKHCILAACEGGHALTGRYRPLAVRPFAVRDRGRGLRLRSGRRFPPRADSGAAAAIGGTTGRRNVSTPSL